MKYLYKNEDDFTVERKLGHTWYYCKTLKDAIEKYALSETPDYDELERIIKRIDIYMGSSRYLGALGTPIYCTSGYASDIMLIRTALLNVDRKKMSNEQIQKFYKNQIRRIDKAYEDYQSDLRTS
ncbi:MAG: hypothetical protein ACFFCC_19780 [Promethearchaeota archaeon]